MPAAYRSIYVKFEANTQQLGKALKSIDGEAKQVNADLKEINKGLKLDPNNTTLMAKKFQALADGVDNVNARLKMLKEARKQALENLSGMDRASQEYKELSAQVASLDREIEKSGQTLANYQREIKNTADSMRDKLKSAVSDLKDEMSGMVSVIAKAEAALVAFSVASAKVGANFDAAMSQVAATLQAEKGTEEYKKLEAAAKEMGETTSYTAAQAAMALQSLSQAGYTADESIERLPKTLTLAKAGGLDLASSAKIVTNSMAALQLSEDELDGLLDKMARTAQKSNTNISELGDAIRTVGGTMNMAGQSVDTMLTELGMLANAGISASEAGTHLRNIMLALTKTDVRKSLHEMGVEVLDSTGEIRDLTEIMTELRDVTKSMGTGELTETFGNLFNVRDLSSINALLNGTKGSMQALRAELENSEGAAMQMAETMSDNLTGDVTILKSAFEGLQIAISDKLTPSLREAAQEGTGFLSELTDQVKNGKLADDFERLGASLKNLLSSGFDTAARWLPTVIDLLTTVAEHFDDILSIYLAMQAYAKTKALVTAVGEIAVSVVNLTKVIRGAEAAQEAFNVASAANPLGAIATAAAAAVAALTLGITKLTISVDTTGEAWGKASKEVTDYTDGVNKIAEASRQMREEREQNLSAIADENDRISELTRTITTLADKQELSSGEYETLKQYIGELNESVPGLNLAFDDQTNSLNMTSDALAKLTESYAAYRQLQSEIDYNADLKRKQRELKAKYEETRTQLAEANDIYKNPSYHLAKGDYRDISAEDLARYTLAAAGLRNELDELDKELGLSDDAILELTENAKVYSDTVTELEEKEKSAAEAAEKNRNKQEALKNAYTNAKTAVGTYKSELKDLIGVLDNVNKGTAYSTSQILDLIDKYPQLASAIHETADGYIVEAEAVRELSKAKAEELVASAKAQLSVLKAEYGAMSPYDIEPDSEYNKRRRQVEQQIAMYQQIADDVSSGNIYYGSSGSSSSGASGSSSDPYDDWLKAQKEAAKAEEAELENQYKTERITAEEYYNGLMDIARRYYAGIGELRNEYLDAESKVYQGLKKAQEDELSNAQKLTKQLREVKEAEDALNRAQTQKVQVYSGAAGFHAEADTSAIEKAQQTLADKNYSLAETLLKNAKFNGQSLSERLRSIGLSDIRDMLPDLSGLRLPTIGGGTSTTNNSTRNVTYNGGDINITVQGNVDPQSMPTLQSSIEEAVRAGIDAFLDEENAQRQTGGI